MEETEIYSYLKSICTDMYGCQIITLKSLYRLLSTWHPSAVLLMAGNTFCAVCSVAEYSESIVYPTRTK